MMLFHDNSVIKINEAVIIGWRFRSILSLADANIDNLGVENIRSSLQENIPRLTLAFVFLSASMLASDRLTYGIVVLLSPDFSCVRLLSPMSDADNSMTFNIMQALTWYVKSTSTRLSLYARLGRLKSILWFHHLTWHSRLEYKDGLECIPGYLYAGVNTKPVWFCSYGLLHIVLIVTPGCFPSYI